MEKRYLSVNLIYIILFLFVILLPNSYAAIFYVNGSNGNDGNSGTSWSNAFRTIGEGIQTMNGGDTLMIADGVYDATQGNRITNVKNGTPSSYTTLKAENDYKVIIDGSSLSSGGTLGLNGRSYVQIIGIGSSQTPDTAFFTDRSHHIKVFNCSIFDAGGAAVGFGTGVQDALVEGCFAWGNSRYTYQVSSSPACQPVEFPGDRRYNCTQNIVFRRNVARWDYTTVDEPPGSFTNYLQTDIYFFNNLAIDGSGLAFNDWTSGEINTIHANPIAFLTASGHDKTEFRGNIVLNYKGFGFVMSGQNPYIGRNVKVEDNVIWDLSPSPSAELAGYNSYLGRSLYVPNQDLGPDSHIYNHNTFGNIVAYEGHYIDAYQSSQHGQSTSKNSIYYNITLPAGQAALDAMISSHNVFYGNTRDYDLCSGILCTHPDGTDQIIDPLTSFSSIVQVSDPGNILNPADDGRERGAEVMKLIGQPGTMYGEPGWNETTNIDLWPWPNEDIIKEQMGAFYMAEGEKLEGPWVSCTVDVNTDIFTCPGHGISSEDEISFRGDSLPNGLPHGVIDNLPYQAFCVRGDQFLVTGLKPSSIPVEGTNPGQLNCDHLGEDGNWTAADDYMDITSTGSNVQVALGWNNPEMSGNRGFVLAPSLTDYVLNYIDGVDLQSCSELGGNVCTGDQGCDGTSVPSSDGQCCLGTCRNCELTNSFWVDNNGDSIEGNNIQEGESVYRKTTANYCDGKSVRLEIWENDIDFGGEDSGDDYITETLINIPSGSSSYEINSEWVTEWTMDGITNPEYYFKAILVDDESINSKSGEINVIQDTTSPVISNVVSNPGPSSSTISWTTDEESNSTVYYGLSQLNLNNVEGSSSLVTSHTIQLIGLDAETTYYYKVESCDSNENCAESSISSFTTNAIADVTLDYTSLEDTKITPGQADVNHGGRTSLNLDANNYNILMRWDLSGYQGQTLESAVLKLYNNDGNNLGQTASLTISPMAINYWVEGNGVPPAIEDGATWNEYNYSGDSSRLWPGGIANSYNSADSVIAQATKLQNSYLEFDITELVQSLLDGTYDWENGFYITSNVYLNFPSAEGSSNQPQLELNFGASQEECQVDGDCNDGVSCTVNSCVNNNCVYTPNNNLCDDNLACSVDTCDVNLGCQYDYSSCDTEFYYLDSEQWTGNLDVLHDGNIVYTTMPFGLQAWDTSDVSNPILLDKIYFEDEGSGSNNMDPYRLALYGDLLGVTTNTGRLYLIDVTNPSSMNVYGYVSGLGSNPAVRFNSQSGKTIAYVVGDASSGVDNLNVYDVTNPSSIIDEGGILMGNGDSTDLVILNNRAYVLNANQGIFVADVSNYESPTQVGSLIFDPAYLTAPLKSITASGNNLVVGANSNGFLAVNIANPDSPVFGQQIIPRFGTTANLKTMDVYLNGNYLYLAAFNLNGEGGFGIYDMNNLDQFAEYYGPTSGWGSNTENFIDVDLNREVAYFTQWHGENAGVVIHDFSNLNSITWEGTTKSYDYCRAVASDGDHVYCATGHMGLIGHDHSNMNDLVEGGALLIGNSQYNGCWGVVAIGDLAYGIATDDGLVIADFSDFENPVELGRVNGLEDVSARDVKVVGSIAYVASDLGITTVDVSNPNNPILLDSARTTAGNSDSLKVDVSGNVAAVADHDNGFSLWNIQNPSNILPLYNLDLPLRVIDVDFYQNYLFVSEANGVPTHNIYVYDITNPSNPTYIGQLNTGYSSNQLCSRDCPNPIFIENDILYLARRVNGITAYDLSSNLLNPSEIDGYDTADEALSVFKEDNRVYVADNFGLTALQFGGDVQVECQVDGDCNDGVSCTVNSCVNNNCVYTPNNNLCDDGTYCNGAETCHATLDCQNGVAPITDDGVSCTVDSCDETNDEIIHAPNDGSCSNGLYCDGTETCDSILDCQDGTAPIIDDGVSCTVDSCDETNDEIIHTPNDGACGDGLWCNGAETCHATLDCQVGTPVSCGDEYSCTDDSCNENSDSCDNVPNDNNCVGEEVCNINYFDPPTGCGLILDCTGQPDGTLCDDGIYCNGVDECSSEICVNVGPILTCDDGISCTIDSCNENSDSCGNVPNNNLCDDGFWCTVGGVCDSVLDCLPEVPRDCSDGLSCSVDSCDEGSDQCLSDESSCPVDIIINVSGGVWNYISIPVELANLNTDQLGAVVLLEYDSTNNRWLTNIGPFQQINELQPMKGYIILTAQNTNIEFSGVYSGAYLLENDKWNLVGVNRSGTIDQIYPGAGEILVYRWDSDFGQLVMVDSSENLEPGIAYWIGIGEVSSPPQKVGESDISGKILNGLIRIFGYFILDIPLPTGNLLINPLF